MKQRKHRFVVGQTADFAIVRGSQYDWYAHPMTLNQAKSGLRRDPNRGAIIYELVPRPDLGQSDGKGGIKEAGK